jgi:lipopolysaccharide transport system ATP-binding protein
MNQPVLHVDRVGKRYATYGSNLARFATWFGAKVHPLDEFWAARDISFSLRKGEALALIGQNGAGKSTLLKLITGTVRPTTGAVAVAGRVSAILELGLGFNPEFTGRQNIYQAGGLMGFSRERLTALMPEMEDFAELGEFFDKPLRVYSSGMQARLAFSLVTAVRPDVLIVEGLNELGRLAAADGRVAITLGRLADELSMSKSGVAGHFGSKLDLQLAVL